MDRGTTIESTRNPFRRTLGFGSAIVATGARSAGSSSNSNIVLTRNGRKSSAFDHDAGGVDEMAHDVGDEGLHMDVYRDNEKDDTVSITGPIPPPVGFTSAEGTSVGRDRQRIRHSRQAVHSCFAVALLSRTSEESPSRSE